MCPVNKVSSVFHLLISTSTTFVWCDRLNYKGKFRVVCCPSPIPPRGHNTASLIHFRRRNAAQTVETYWCVFVQNVNEKRQGLGGWSRNINYDWLQLWLPLRCRHFIPSHKNSFNCLHLSLFQIQVSSRKHRYRVVYFTIRYSIVFFFPFCVSSYCFLIDWNIFL